MSVLTPFTAVYESASITGTTADAGATVVYTVPSSFDAEITMLLCTNGSATHNASVQVYHADTNVYSHLLRLHSISGNDTYNVLGPSRLYLHAGDKILAYKSAGTLDVSLSGKQYFNPARTIS
jgi:hypothetical protein